MLRSLIIYLSRAAWAQRLVTHWGFARKTALRFVAGETADDAIAAVRALNAIGMNATLDLLGEDVSSPAEARESTVTILDVLARIDQTGVRSNVSIKLSQIGLVIDERLCEDNLIAILQNALELGTFVRIDMEDSSSVDATLRIYEKMRAVLGFDNVGLVIQSYLYRSEKDTQKLLLANARIRIVKGAYRELPDVAYPRKSDVDQCFDELVRMLLDAAIKRDDLTISEDGKFPPMTAIATHDEARIESAKKYAESTSMAMEKLEFQMLYGIRRKLQTQLVAEGYPVRIYVPFGRQWYSYFMRRLAERPANLWFFLTSLFSN